MSNKKIIFERLNKSEIMINNKIVNIRDLKIVLLDAIEKKCKDNDIEYIVELQLKVSNI